MVKRFGDISVKALGESGEEFIFSLDGLEAVAVQHENDHLDGILFIDHVSAIKRRFILKKVAKVTKKPSAKKAKPSPRAKARKERKRQKAHRRRA